jgi:archaetidylinositol phosphate synthase
MISSPPVDLTTSTPHRITNGVVGRHEPALLNYLAYRTPQWVTPDHMTFFGVAGAALTGLAAVMSNIAPGFLWLALLGLLINWVGDSLDGTIARLRGIERPRYGFFVDHLSDLASQIMIVIGLGLSPLLRFDMVCLGLISYLAMSVYTLVKLHVTRSMQLTYFGFGPTEVRIFIGAALVLAATTNAASTAVVGGFNVFDCGAAVVVGVALCMIVVSFVRDLPLLAKNDPPRNMPLASVSMTEIVPGRGSAP